MSPIVPDLLHHHKAMRRLATRLVVADDVDDVVQETMVRALEHPPRGDLGAWLGSVLRNVVRFRRRSNLRRRERETLAARRDAAAGGRGSDHGEPIDTLQELEAAEQVSRALRRLPEPYRTVLVQRYFLRRSLADVAQEQGVREDAIRQRHKRGLDMMRTALAKSRADGSAPLTRDRLVMIFAPWLTPLPPIAPPALVAAPASGAATALALLITAMKSKVALGIAAFVALASLSAYALWTPGAGSAPAPVDPPAVDTQSADVARPREDPSAATARTEVIDTTNPRTEPAAATGPGADIRLVWDDDGAAATGMQVFLTQYGLWSSDSPPEHIATTGDDGVAKFRGLRETRYLLEGRFKVATRRASVVEVTAASLDGDPFEVRILRGTTVTGRVVDPEGRGIAGATVLRAGWASPWTQELGITEADGSFAIDGLHGRISMGARAAGFVPSTMRSLNLDEKGSHTIECLLQPAAAELTVRVVDTAGAPVADARAGVGVFGRQNRPRRGADGANELVMPTHSRTDERGVARLGGLAAGTWAIEVSAEGHSGYIGEVDVPPLRAGDDATPIEREIVLPAPIAIAGTARDGSGMPLKGVHVQFGRSGHFVNDSSTTGTDGTYRLQGAPVGDVEMRAQHKGLNRTATIQTLPGREHTWDVAFAADRKVHGSVTWQDGSPVPSAEFSVSSIGAGQSWHTIDHTDESGRFMLEMPDHVAAVRMRLRAPGSFLQRVHEGPLPKGNLDIVLGPEHVPSATLRGRIVEPDGEPIPGANLWHALLGQGNSSPIDVDAEGRFEENVTPGTFGLRIEVDGFARARVEIEVGSNEEKDLGDIVLEHPAAIHVTIDGAPEGEIIGWLTQTDTDRRTRLEIVNGQGSLGGLPGGKYRLQVCGDTLANESHDLFLKAAPGGGDPTEVRLVARPATPIDLTLTLAEGSTSLANRVADIEILDAAGQVVVRHRAAIQKDDRPYAKFALAPGRFELRAREGELSGRATFSLPAVTTEPHRVALELRPGG